MVRPSSSVVVVVASGSLFAAGLIGIAPAAQAVTSAPTTGHIAVVAQNPRSVVIPAATSGQKEKSSLKIRRSASTVKVKNRVQLSARFYPETVRKVKFQKRKGNKKNWDTVGTADTDGHGAADVYWKPKKHGTYKVRAVGPKNEQFTKVVSSGKKVKVASKHGPKAPGSKHHYKLTADFPAKAYVDVPSSVPVKIKPKLRTSVEIQSFDSTNKVWFTEDLSGASGKTKKNGKTSLSSQYGIAETLKYRVASGKGAISGSSKVTVDGDWLKAFYQPPGNAPTKPGKLIRTMPMTGTVPKPPVPLIPEAKLPAGTQQYRFLYTTKRHNPKTLSSKPAVASGMTFMPDPKTPAPKGYSKHDRPVVVWAHPTLGTAFPCAPSTGQDGYQINYLDMGWFMSAGGNYVNLSTQKVLPRPGGLLANGYVVVVPDYLSVGTPGKETYLIGQQEANDVIYAAKAIQRSATSKIAWTEGKAPESVWPGAGAGNKFVVPGHSQGGHAALWTGANKKLAKNQHLKLLGTAPIAPASDLVVAFEQAWDQLAGWVIGPYAAQTFVDYFGNSFEDSLTPEGRAALPKLSKMCATQAATYVQSHFMKNGVLTATFSKQPDAAGPTFATTWGVQLNEQTPILAGMKSQAEPTIPDHKGYDLDLPTLLVQGQADNIVIAQATAALQDRMCKAGAPLSTYWPVANPVPIPGVLGLQANHLDVLSWPIADFPISGEDDAVTPSSTVAEWIDGVFLGQTPTNCAEPWQVETDGTGVTSIHEMLPQGPCPVPNAGSYNCATPSLAAEGANDNPRWLFEHFVGDPGQEGPAFGANTQGNGVPKFTDEFAGVKVPGLYAYAASNQLGVYPFSAALDTSTWQRTAVPGNSGGFVYDNAGPGKSRPWGLYPANGAYFN